MSNVLDWALLCFLLFIGIVALSLAVTWLMCCWLHALGGPLPQADSIEFFYGRVLPAADEMVTSHEFAPRDPDTRAEAAPVVRELAPETLIEIGPTVFTAHEIAQLACVRRDREWW